MYKVLRKRYFVLQLWTSCPEKSDLPHVKGKGREERGRLGSINSARSQPTLNADPFGITKYTDGGGWGWVKIQPGFMVKVIYSVVNENKEGFERESVGFIWSPPGSEGGSCVSTERQTKCVRSVTCSGRQSQSSHHGQKHVRKSWHRDLPTLSVHSQATTFPWL